MKGRFEIKVHILELEKSLNGMKDKYSRMHYLDIQSGDSVQMREAMNKTQSEIDALKWVIENDKET